MYYNNLQHIRMSESKQHISTLCSDTVNLVGNFLPREDVTSLCNTNKENHRTLLEQKTSLYEWHLDEKILDEPFYNHIKKVIIHTLKDFELCPNGVTHLVFGWSFNQPLNVGVIPSSVTHLVFGWSFNQPLNVGVIPSNVTHLTFGNNFDQHLNVGVIPSSVTHLVFGWDFNQPLNVGVIPSSVTHLRFGYSLNQRLNQLLNVGVIPSSVTHLTLCYKLKDNLDIIPKNCVVTYN